MVTTSTPPVELRQQLAAFTAHGAGFLLEHEMQKTLKINPAFRNLIPPLAKEELAQLEENIVRDGCRDPLVAWDGVIVDGHNRYEICTRRGIPFNTVDVEFESEDAATIWVIQNQFGRRNLPAYERARLALALEPLIAKKAKEKEHERKTTCQKSDKSSTQPIDTKREVARVAGVSHDTIAKVKVIEAKASPEVKSKLSAGTISINEAHSQIKRAEKEEIREVRRGENRAKIADIAAPADIVKSDARFATILLDPPWDWGDEGDVNQMGRAKPDYATMSFEELCNLPIQKLSDEDAHIYMWITNRSLPKGFALLEKWGFRYVTALTWPKPSIGMGNYFRGQTEHILFGVRGSQMLKRKDASTLLPTWKRGSAGHSSKPVEIYDFIESCSPGPYLEMFSRNKRDGWFAWGADSQ